jgi:multidrug efflux pump subunit AcrA (membrane-fusion protein)
VAEGQAVKAGEPLFKMETPPPASRYSYENAVKDYERLQKLYEKGAVPAGRWKLPPPTSRRSNRAAEAAAS